MSRQVMSLGEYAIRIIIFVAVTSPAAAEQRAPTGAATCQSAGPLTRVPELPEGSGVAVSQRSLGRLWAHNDSGEPVLVALDSQGAVVGRVRVSGATVEDWEAVAVGPCPTGSCIYVGDIGDNDARRQNITIYRVPEPANASGSVAVTDAFHATYPDGPRDAESLLVTPKGDIVIVTKGETGPVALYRVPSAAKPGGAVTLQLLGSRRRTGKAAAGERITDGTVSPSGAWVALRTNGAVLLYRTEDLMSGKLEEATRVSLKPLGEPQGEGIAFGDETTIYVIGEGGGKARPGTFGRLTCTL